MNGWSNRYYGWGGEDDDFGLRFINHRKNITRPNPVIGRYSHAKHVRKPKNIKSRKLREETRSKRWNTANDGIKQLHYKLEEIKLEKLFTHLKVNVRMAEEEYKLTDARDKDH